MTTRDEVLQAIYKEFDAYPGFYNEHVAMASAIATLRDRLAEAERAQCRAAVLVAQVVQAAEAYADAWVSGDDWGYDMDHALPNLITAVRAYRKAPL